MSAGAKRRCGDPDVIDGYGRAGLLERGEDFSVSSSDVVGDVRDVDVRLVHEFVQSPSVLAIATPNPESGFKLSKGCSRDVDHIGTGYGVHDSLFAASKM